MDNYLGGYDRLDGSSRYRTVASELISPLPARVFVFMDENEDSIEDGTLAMFPPPLDLWLNLPGSRHNAGTTLSFADSHVEHWRWKAGLLPFRGWPQGAQPNELWDLHRLQACIPDP